MSESYKTSLVYLSRLMSFHKFTKYLLSASVIVFLGCPYTFSWSSFRKEMAFFRFFTSYTRSFLANAPYDVIHVLPNICTKSFRIPCSVRSGRDGTRVFLDGDDDPFFGNAR